jgi:farnesol kinase
MKAYNYLHVLVSGLADIVGRRFGTQKLPHNRNKSIAGSVAMASAGFLSSVG